MTIYERSVAGPLFSILDRDRFPPSVANLPAALTINGITVLPTFRYNGKDANATNWPAWGYGETLTLQAGTAPTYNNGSPLLGSVDDSVTVATGGGFYQSGGTVGNITTEDFVAELIVRPDAGTAIPGYWVGTYGTKGWMIYNGSGATDARGYAAGGGSVGDCWQKALTQAAWHHIIMFYDASGSCCSYINGVASNAVAVSGVGSLTSATKLYLGGVTASVAAAGFCYAAMWKGASWLDTHLQATVAKTRFAQLTGVYPQQARGTALPTVMARTTAAYLDKIEADGTTKLYYVGANWPRVCSRKDTNGNIVRGYLSETAATNYVLQSETLQTTWGQSNLTTVSVNSANGPDGIAKLDGIVGDATAGIHGLNQAITFTAAAWVCSGFARVGNKTWLYADDGVQTAYFNIGGMVAGTLGAGVTGGVIDCGGGLAQWWFSRVMSAGAKTCFILAADSDGDNSFSGDTTTVNMHLGCIQWQLGNYPSTYIPTTTAAVTRTADNLRYKMDDGNLTAGKGSLVVDFMGANIDQAGLPVYSILSDGTANNELDLRSWTGDDYPAFYGVAATAAQINVAGATDIYNGNKHTIRATWKTNDARQYVDGAADGTPDAACTIPTGLTQLDVGAYLSAGYEANGLISNLEIYSLPTTKSKPGNGR